jgi:putative ABC transport system permease protein
MMWTRWFRLRSTDDFAAEVESHISMETDRLMRGGMSEDDARYAARRAFGNTTSSREQFREARTGAWFETLMQDVRYGLRAMRRSPGFTAIAVASFAIGIGANTTMFGAIDTLLFRPPAHVIDADLIHRVYFAVPDGRGSPARPWPVQGYRSYLALRDSVAGFEAVAAFSAKKISSGRGADARPFDAVMVTPSFFTLLGSKPAMGRFFLESEERDEGSHVAVLGYEAWRSEFGGDPKLLGRSIDVAATPYTIVGIAPEGFTGVDLNRVDLWLPIGAGTRLVSRGVLSPNGGGYWLEIIARRQLTASIDRLTEETARAYKDAWRDQPRFDETFALSRAILGPVIASRGPVPTADARVSVWVAAVSLLVLLIASANVANLLLLRSLARSREVALRLSLGATRWRVTRQWLVEGALLAAAGALGALVVARWSAAAVHAFLLPKLPPSRVIDGRMLAFTALIAIGSAVLASLIPALVTSRRDFGPLLGSGRSTSSPTKLRLQRALIGGQVALATVLLVGAGLFVTSLRNVRAIDLGIDTEHVLYARVDFGSAGKLQQAPGASVRAVYTTLLESVRRVPGVVNATVTSGEPLTTGWGMSLRRRGAGEIAPGTPVPMGRAVGAHYFETMGTSLRRGRLFTEADHVPDARVAIIDEQAAKQFFPDGSGLDPCVYLNGTSDTCTEIVGVVENTVLWDITGDRVATVYVPVESRPDQALSMMEIRTAGDPAALIPSLRQALLAVVPDLAWADIRPLSDRMSPQLRSWQLGASMFTAFGVLALLLAAVGFYGLISYVVTQRAHEIGIRKALGAADGEVVRSVLRGVVATTTAGAVAGVLVALFTGRFVASQLYGVSPRDPSVIVLSTCVLLAVSIVACLAPARRATKVDPLITLRAE